MSEKTSSESSKRKIPLLKHYVPVWAMLLVVLTMGAAMAVVVSNYHPIAINVGEPLVLDQSLVTYNTVAGSTETFSLSVQNSANNPITFTLSWSSEQAALLTLTANEQALAQAGLQFTVPARTQTGSGDFIIGITATTSTSAEPSTVTIQFTVTR